MVTHSLTHFIRIGLFVGMFVNLAYLNLQLYKGQAENTDITEVAEVPLRTEEGCGDSCIKNIYTAIEEATSSQKLQAEPVAVNNSAVKEYFISLGSGSSATEDWATIPGAEAYIDKSSYPNIKSVNFEASINIPTGNQKAYARLFNITDKHPVWFSEVSLEGGATQLLTSPNIQLDEGRKLYAVQMKTSLKYQANLIQSRVHIILK